MIKSRKKNDKIFNILFSFGVLFVCFSVSANENVVGESNATSEISSTRALIANDPVGRELTSPAQLTETIRQSLGLPNTEISEEAFGEGNHPFTTKRASSQDGMTPIDKMPWRVAGKLFMNFDGGTSVCSATVIDKSVLVTAAHCVHQFGQGQDGFADSVSFEPARYELARPFGTWIAKEWWIPKVYFDGTDKCSVEAPGVVCENDVAVIVMEENHGKAIGDVVGKIAFNDGIGGDGNYGYANFLGKKSAQITQLGYPARNFDGDKMIRTDSLGYQDPPNNVVIGSNQTGGSSGSAWIQNFGVTTSFSGTQPTNNESNQIVATTSWGYTNGVVKIQGASRFSKNTTYTLKSNIRSLVESACAANPGSCE